MDAESPRLRLSILGIVVLSLFGTLFARLWYLQVLTATEFQKVAEQNTTRLVYTEAPRGRILDRWGRVLVDNRLSLVVTVNPHELDLSKRRDDVLLSLATELTRAGIPTKVAEIESRLTDKRFDPLQPIPVAIDVPEELEIALEERSEDYPGVAVSRESVRNYPNDPKTTAVHVLGYTGRISQEEFEAKQGTKDAPKDNPKPYQPDSEIGKTGVEKVYEDKLRGTPGVCRLEVDARNKPVRTTECTPPVPGNDLVLTIDLGIQQNMETQLALELLGERGTYTQDGKVRKSPAGSAVAIDPRNGEVVAMASFPTFDPSEFVNGISEERYKQLTGGAASDNAFINRAIAGQYAPGSTFKLITANAALSQGLIDGNSTIYDGGSLTFGGQTFRSAGDSKGAGGINVTRALTVSSDVFFYSLGLRYWQERARWGNGIQDTAGRFGLNAPTGIPLPGEESGGVFTPETWKARHDANPTAFPEGNWLPGNSIQGAIGQNTVLATPIQIATSFATFTQHGTRYQPSVVRKVVKPGTTNVFDPANDVEVLDPVVAQQFPIPPNVYDPIFQGLLGVPQKGGTAGGPFEGWNFQTWPFGGKTGTAEVCQACGKADTSLFVAFGPAPDVQIVVAAVLEESGFGADAAAPVVRKILEPIANQVPPAFPDPNAAPANATGGGTGAPAPAQPAAPRQNQTAQATVPTTAATRTNVNRQTTTKAGR